MTANGLAAICVVAGLAACVYFHGRDRVINHQPTMHAEPEKLIASDFRLGEINTFWVNQESGKAISFSADGHIVIYSGFRKCALDRDSTFQPQDGGDLTHLTDDKFEMDCECYAYSFRYTLSNNTLVLWGERGEWSGTFHYAGDRV